MDSVGKEEAWEELTTPLALMKEYRANELRRQVYAKGLEKIAERQAEIKEALRPLFKPDTSRTFWLGTGEPIPVICTAFVPASGNWFSLAFVVPENPATLEWPKVEATAEVASEEPAKTDDEDESVVPLYKRDLRDLDEAS